MDIQLADGTLALVIDRIPLGGIGEAKAKSTYSLVNNKHNQKITASLDAAMPSETKLTLVASAPKGAERGQGCRTLREGGGHRDEGEPGERGRHRAGIHLHRHAGRRRRRLSGP